jgi:hypothetical protein
MKTAAVVDLIGDLAFAYRAGAGFRPDFVAPNSYGYDK